MSNDVLPMPVFIDPRRVSIDLHRHLRRLMHSYDNVLHDHEAILDAVVAGDRDLAGVRMANHLATSSSGG